MKNFLILIFFALSLFANEEFNFTKEELNFIKNKKEIIVSNEIDYEPIDFNIDGKPMGYSIDLLEKLLKGTGLKIKYVSNTWTNLFNDFENKKIDLVHTLYKSKEREDKFIFSKGYLKGIHSIVTRKTYENISSIEQLFGKKVGVTEGWFQERYIKKFPQINRVYFNNLKEKLQALENGEIDAIINNKYVANYFIKKYEYSTLGVYDFLGNELNKKTNTFHFAANKENKILIDIINKSFSNLSQNELENLSKKWFGEEEKNLALIDLSNEELNYIKSLKSLKFPTYSDWKPFNYVEDGIENGYIIELTKLIAKKLNVNLQFVNGYTRDKHQEILSNAKVNLVGSMSKTPQTEELYLFSQIPTLVVSSAIVSKNNYKKFKELEGKKLGILKNSAHENYLKEKYPNIINISYSTVLELIQAISNDEVDAVMDNYSVINYQLNRLNLLNDLKINIVLDEKDLTLPLHYATSIDNPILISIINKVYSQISPQDINELKKKWGLFVPNDIKLEEETVITLFGKRFSKDFILIFVLAIVLITLMLKLLNTNKNITNKSEDLKKDLKQNKSLLYGKYILGLLILFITLVVSFLTIESVNNNKIGLAKTINLSGKQRMLSQRITLHAMQYQNEQNDEFKYKYINLIENMKKDHEEILKSISNEKILNFYTNNPNLNLQVSNFIRLNKDYYQYPSSEKLNEILSAQELLLKNLDNAVSLHETYLNDIDKNMSNIIWSSMILLIIILLLEAFFIFTPLIKKILLIAENFQEEKEKATQISNEQKSLLSLFDKSDAVLFKWNNDENWSVKYVSNNIENLCGYTKDDFLNKKIKFSEIINQNDLQKVTNEVKDFLSNNKKFLKHEPYRITTKSGQIKWVLDYTTLNINNEGIVTDFIGYLVDITQLIEITEKLKDSEQEIKKTLEKSLKSEEEARIAEEEALATQEQLEVLNEELKHAYDAKSEFLSNMSHEIRTPLSGIIGITDIILENDKLTNEDKKNLEIVKSSSNRLKGIINDILDFSKIQAGKFQIIQNEFSLRNLVEDLENLFAPQFINKTLQFKIQISDNVEDILIGDELRINQILTNLIGNSLKFTNTGIIELSIMTISKNYKTTKIEFTIKDTGIGMTQNVQKSVFESFTQGELSNTKNFQGTGLGLSISKKLVELMGGKISFESLENVGTSFYFTLELGYLKNRTIQRKEIVHYDNVKFDNSSILVAEDSVINRLVIEKYLKDVSLNVDFAFNGVEAVQKAREKNYRLIFMDIQMPEMDGYEATVKIRYFNKDVPIIALSAAVLHEDVIKSIDAGMNEHLAKPIDRHDLYTLLGKYLTNNILLQEQNMIEEKLSIAPEFKKIFNDFGKTDAIDLLEIFLEQYENFQFKILNHNKDEVKKVVHKLKGASSNLGFKNIVALCKSIESLDCENCEDKIQILIKKLDELLIKIRDIIS